VSSCARPSAAVVPRSTSGSELEPERPEADESLVDRRVVWIFVVVGSTIGSLAPMVWGGSTLGVASLALGCLGGIAGLWCAAKLTA
jgi:hypothetical protein